MLEATGHRPTRALISLDNLAFNLRSARAFMGEGQAVMGVVKADAYGHGAVECARRLQHEGIDWLAVAIPEEALELRQSGVTLPLLCLGGFWPGQERQLIEHGITPVIYSIDQAERLNRAAAHISTPTDVHVKVDSGMGRVGIPPAEARHFAEALGRLPNIKVDGILSHFAVADDLTQTDFTEAQTATLNRCVDAFNAAGHSPTLISIANSPGAIAHPGSRCNLVRLGGILYGLGGDVLPKIIPVPELRPVMRLETRIADIKMYPAGSSLGYGRTHITARDSRIGLIPIGYHDGLPRALSNLGRVLVEGRRVPIVGRVSMDWTLIDLTEVPDAKVSDVVTIIGRDDGELIQTEDLAVATGTISYEITCGIGARVPRIYDQGA